MATIRKRQLKNGENAYTIQVKFKDKGSGKRYSKRRLGVLIRN